MIMFLSRCYIHLLNQAKHVRSLTSVYTNQLVNSVNDKNYLSFLSNIQNNNTDVKLKTQQFHGYFIANRILGNRWCSSAAQTEQMTKSYDESKDDPQTEDEELDKLYKMIEIEIRGHETAVMKSYQMYVTMAARELGIRVGRCWEPFRHIQRRTLLRAGFVKKKYRVQYEWRTYFRIMQFHHLTGSTADTFLEYIQRNLPEGLAMKVNRTAIERLPGHIAAPKSESIAK